MSGTLFGDDNGAVRHSDRIVAVVRALHGRGLSQRNIARRTGVSQRQVGRIVRAEARTGLPLPARTRSRRRTPLERCARLLDAWAARRA